MSAAVCAICNGSRPRRSHVCARCAREHNLIGVPFTEWPKWVLGIVTAHRSWGRSEAEAAECETQMPSDIMAESFSDPDWLGRVHSALGMSGEAGGGYDAANLLDNKGQLQTTELSTPLPYAPYQDAAANRHYRAACKIDATSRITDDYARNTKPLETGKVYAHGEHIRARIDPAAEGFRLTYIDWWVREHVDGSGRAIPARYEKRPVWMRR
jgi:hypothetical protein